MSPEQVTGGHVDHRADLYSLGIVGYEMLVGKPPFGGNTPTEILMKRVAQPAQPIEKVRADTPPGLAEVINRCLEQDPARRYSTGGEIVRALGGTTTSGGHSTAEMVRRARRARLPWALALAGALVLVVAVGALVVRTRTSRGAGPAGPPEGMVLVPTGTYTIGRDGGHAVSRPAHQVALAAFYLDRTEVTVGAFRRVAAQTSVGIGWRAPAEADSLLPVTGVTWPMAMAYCGTAHPPRGRLPTEEEWEAAARGPNAFLYPWGDAWQAGVANTASAGHQRPIRVESIRRGNTALGAADMIGNVWEWTMSHAVAYPGGAAPPRAGADAYIIRGCAFDTPDSIADATYRGYLPAMSTQLDRTGFRCVVPAM
jgi:formylglycine-generating enzyme required for sulfatase activity